MLDIFVSFTSFASIQRTIPFSFHCGPLLLFLRVPSVKFRLNSNGTSHSVKLCTQDLSLCELTEPDHLKGKTELKLIDENEQELQHCKPNSSGMIEERQWRLDKVIFRKEVHFKLKLPLFSRWCKSPQQWGVSKAVQITSTNGV